MDEEYKPQNKEYALQALHEIMQEVALAGLQRAGFFEKAAFYGGTALRIYGLTRYSEDIDFSLLEVNPAFSLEKYLQAIKEEFESLGMQVSVREKKKTMQNEFESAPLKSETFCKELMLEHIIRQTG